MSFSGLEGILETLESATYIMIFVRAGKTVAGAPIVVVARTPRSYSSWSHTMTLASTSSHASVFKDGRLKPGVYKIQNVVGQTYVDLREYTRELCCRPATALEGGGLVGSCPRLVHIVVIVTIFSGKSTLWVLDIPYTWYSRGLHCNLTVVC